MRSVGPFGRNNRRWSSYIISAHSAAVLPFSEEKIIARFGLLNVLKRTKLSMPTHLTQLGVRHAKKLLESGHRVIDFSHDLDIHRRDKAAYTLLHECAVTSADIELFDCLVSLGLDASAVTSGGMHTPLSLASKNPKGQDLALSLLERDSNRPGSLLWSAASQGHMRLWAALMEEGRLDINARGDAQRTPLHEAAIKGNLELATLFLQHGASLECDDDAGNLPIHSQLGGASPCSSDFCPRH